MGENIEAANRPKISVIIPVYNTEDYLREMLNSMIRQTFQDVEFIAVNDGSTDGSLAILEEYALIDKRIRVFSQTNKGLSVTRNVGLDSALGKYVYFMDSDDKLELETLEACYNQCESNQLDVIAFDASIFGEDIHCFNNDHYKRSEFIPNNIVLDGVNFLKISLKNNAFRSSVPLYIMRKELIDQFHFRFYPGIIHEDQLYTVQAFANSRRIMYIPFAFYKRRIRSNSIMTNQFSWKNLEGYMTVFDQLLAMDWSNEQQEVIDLHISITLNALLRYVIKGLTRAEKIRFMRICVTRYKKYYHGHNLFLFLMRR